MDATKQSLLRRIEADREVLIDFLRGFIRCKSPNPPGDTREVAAYVRGFLDRHGLAYRVIAPHEQMPNIVATFDAGAPGRHLALNGHMDVFPVDSTGWTVDPWGGELIDGKIYGRGACDMKCGTTTSLFTFLYLHELRDSLHGKLTLSAVSDEETFGPWGARYLVEHHPEILGDCCLNGEPSSRHTVRFGEKGPLWLRFHVRTPGAHGAYTHASPSAVAIAARDHRRTAASGGHRTTPYQQSGGVDRTGRGGTGCRVWCGCSAHHSAGHRQSGRDPGWTESEHDRGGLHIRGGYPAAEWPRRSAHPGGGRSYRRRQSGRQL